MNNRHIFENAGMLCKAAAAHIAWISNESIREKGSFSIALSGGNTPRQLYEMLAQQPWSNSLDWKNIFVFWGDERCVPQNDEQNNSYMASTTLLNKVSIPKENIFPVPTESEPSKAAALYEKTLQKFFGTDLPAFDLVLLGLGDNGHTASLFPYSTILHEKKHIVKDVFVKDLDAYRISFTAGLINNSHHILFLVTGKEKSAIIKTIYSGIYDPEKYPVQLIQSTSREPVWYLDKSAASQL